MKDFCDIPDLPKSMTCSKCGYVIMTFDFPIMWPQETFFSKYHHDYATRVYNLIRHHINKHKCQELPFEVRCSGYGVLPDGKKCRGCGDCITEGDAKAYNEVMSNQTYLDESTNLQQPG